MGQPFHVGKPWCTFANATANAAVGTNAIHWGGGDGDGEIDLAPGDNTTLRISKEGLYLIGCSIGRAAMSPSSGIVGSLTVDGFARRLLRSVGTTAAVSVGAALIHHVTSVTDVQVLTQFSGTTAIAFDGNSTQLWAVRIGPLRWT